MVEVLALTVMQPLPFLLLKLVDVMIVNTAGGYKKITGIVGHPLAPQPVRTRAYLVHCWAATKILQQNFDYAKSRCMSFYYTESSHMRHMALRYARLSVHGHGSIHLPSFKSYLEALTLTMCILLTSELHKNRS